MGEPSKLTSSIGNLTSKIANTLGQQVETQTRSMQPSETGRLTPAREPSKQNLEPFGMDGATELPIAVRAALGDPERAEKALLASLPPPLRSCLKERISTEYDLMGMDLIKTPSREQANQVLAWLDQIDTQTQRSILVQEITRCLTLTKSRVQDENDIALLLGALTQELLEYPADIVISELRKWPRAQKWWPSLSELRTNCDHAWRVRKSLRRALA